MLHIEIETIWRFHKEGSPQTIVVMLGILNEIRRAHDRTRRPAIPVVLRPRAGCEDQQASLGEGARGFAVDLVLDEVVAAIAYHIPEDGSSPLLITALAPRIDVAAPVGRACVPMVKACLHQLGSYLGRGGQLGLRPGGAPIDEAQQLFGFRPAPRGTGRLEVVLVRTPPTSTSCLVQADDALLLRPHAPRPTCR